jgi:hypothetical protein
LEGKGTPANEELGRKVMETGKVKKYMTKHGISEEDELE